MHKKLPLFLALLLLWAMPTAAPAGEEHGSTPPDAGTSFFPETHLYRSLGTSAMQWNGVYTPFVSDGAARVDISDIATQADVDVVAQSIDGLVQETDPRLTDARAPLPHAATHAISGDDRLRPEDIGAVPFPAADGKLYLLSSSGLVEYIPSGGEEGGESGGTLDHAKLLNRDAPDQHPQSAIQHLDTDLEAIRNDIANLDYDIADGLLKKADVNHTHPALEAVIAGKVDATALSAYATTSALSDGLAGKAEIGHTHSIDEVNGLQEALDAAGGPGGGGGIEDWHDNANYLSHRVVFGNDNNLYKWVTPSGPETDVGPRNPIDEPVIDGTPSLSVAQTSLPATRSWRKIVYGNGVFVTIARNSNKAAFSSDGIKWTEATLPASVNWYGLAHGNGVFVAVAIGTDQAAYSADGKTWSAVTLPSSANWYAVSFGNGLFVAVAASSSKTIYSADGKNWTASTLPSTGDWVNITYGNDRFVTTSINSTKAAYSLDGKTWSASNLPSVGKWWGLSYGNDLFVAVATTSNKVAHSVNGVDWVESVLPASVEWYGVGGGNNIFIAVASNTSMAAWSRDCIAWEPITLPVAGSWKDVVYNGDFFVALNEDNTTSAIITPQVSYLPNCWQKIGAIMSGDPFANDLPFNKRSGSVLDAYVKRFPTRLSQLPVLSPAA